MENDIKQITVTKRNIATTSIDTGLILYLILYLRPEKFRREDDLDIFIIYCEIYFEMIQVLPDMKKYIILAF